MSVFQIGTGHWLVHFTPFGEGRGIHPNIFVLFCLLGVSVPLMLCVCLCGCTVICVLPRGEGS